MPQDILHEIETVATYLFYWHFKGRLICSHSQILVQHKVLSMNELHER